LAGAFDQLGCLSLLDLKLEPRACIRT